MGSAPNGGDDKVVETVMVGRYIEMERDGENKTMKSRLSGLLWHGGSAYDAWFSCASNQVIFFITFSFLCFMILHELK